MSFTTNSRLTCGVGHGANFEVPCVTLTEYVHAPVYADDGRTMKGVRTTLRGRGIFASETAFQYFRDAVVATGGDGTSSPEAVTYTMEVRDAGGSWVTISSYALDVPDDIGGPMVRLSAPYAIGPRMIGVEFEIDSQVPPLDVETTTSAVSHTWTQTMQVALDGRLTRIVRGVLSVAPSTKNSGRDDTVAPSPSGGDWNSRNPYPDLYRLAIIPDVPGAGWRRRPQEYALLEDGTGLAYQITDEQCAKDLPYPARDGDAKFRYTRQFPNLGWADISMRVRMAGDLATDIRTLIASAWTSMQIRVNPAKHLLTRISVEEESMFDGIACTCEMDARVYAQDYANTGTLALSSIVGTPFTVTRLDCSRTVSPYGAYQFAWQMPPHWLDNALNAATQQGSAGVMPQAQVIEVELATPCADTAVVTVLPSNTGVAAMNAHFGGAFTQPYPKQADEATADTPTTIMQASSFTAMRVNPGTVRMCSAEDEGQDWVFQTEKPRVRITERVEVSRQNQTPGRSMRPLPANAILVSEGWVPGSLRGDAQGNGVFNAIYERVFDALDPGGTSGGGFNSASFAGYLLRYWQPPNGLILAANNPGLSTAQQQGSLSVLAAATDVRLGAYGTISDPVT